MQCATKGHGRFWFCNLDTQYWDRQGYVDLVVSCSLRVIVFVQEIKRLRRFGLVLPGQRVAHYRHFNKKYYFRVNGK